MSFDLKNGVDEMELEIPLHKQEKLINYLDILVKWNKVFNLTSVQTKQEMISRHLLDSLSIMPWCKGERFLDVGTGAGLPGIPLAIAFPDKFFVLIDSNGKRTRFLHEAVSSLNLTNVMIVNDRVESFQSLNKFDVITSRAYSSLIDLIETTSHLLARKGFWLAMKGEVEEYEINAACGVNIEKYSLIVPGCKSKRYLFKMTL
tara:strand:- start:749 stop:1357 length:609 start_codon:yes stop_codon:yes gene_type:complete